jgi:hypothetical protein
MSWKLGKLEFWPWKNATTAKTTEKLNWEEISILITSHSYYSSLFCWWFSLPKPNWKLEAQCSLAEALEVHLL